MDTKPKWEKALGREWVRQYAELRSQGATEEEAIKIVNFRFNRFFEDLARQVNNGHNRD